MATIILRVSSLKVVSDVSADQPTWLSLLKVEHRGKIYKQNNSEMNIFSEIHVTVLIQIGLGGVKKYIAKCNDHSGEPGVK